MKWLPIELELIKDGYIARITRDRYGSPPRWRWAVCKLDVIQKWSRSVVEQAYARGYCGGLERAKTMAERAIVALKKSELR
jgi:hypothetical protein